MLTEIVSKRMEAIPKLSLIQQLGVVPVREREQRSRSCLGGIPLFGGIQGAGCRACACRARFCGQRSMPLKECAAVHTACWPRWPLNLYRGPFGAQVCARWQEGLPSSPDEEPELAVKYARLLATLATEVGTAGGTVVGCVVGLKNKGEGCTHGCVSY